MTFTDVAFELADPAHPLCRLTAARPARIVYRLLDTGDVSHAHRAHVTLHGPEEAALELARELRTGRPAPFVEVLHQAPDATSLALEAPLRDGPAGLAALPRLLQQHGLGGALSALVASDGRIRGRLTIPRALDSAEAIRLFQGVQRASGFAEGRALHVEPTGAESPIELARRALTPEQEDILALAAQMGYYDTPKAVTLEEIAKRVGLSISPVHKRLKAAEEALVGIHIESRTPEGGRRRARSGDTLEGASPPWEVILRADSAEIGPARVFAGQEAPPRVRLHALSHDPMRGRAWLMVTLADPGQQAKLASFLADRPDVVDTRVVGQGAGHVAHTLIGRERGPFHFPWWADVWGPDAHLRSVSLENGTAHVRVLLVRPLSHERLQARVDESARMGGWHGAELVSARPLATRPPPPAPEPLTTRQAEVLRVAHALGYYRTPRACTLESVASALGVSANAIHKNLVLAESKIITSYLASGL